MDQVKAVLGRQLVAVNGIQITVLVAVLVLVLVWFLFFRGK